ncbi:MAG: M48 family metallopeptidase [Eubacterium sp.]|nr:M48 family metallopeptidase [Eubacterium sp.]
MNYEIIRSRRKTAAIQIKDGKVVVRAPYFLSEKRIAGLVEDKAAWIKKHLDRYEKAKTHQGSEALTQSQLDGLYRKAKEYIPERAAYYSRIIGVEYNRITIRSQKTKWGSCSAKKNLNFNCLLMLTPPEVIDSVVVHELCHLKEMNHSKRFYNEVLKAYPEYKKYNKWLKENGTAILSRLPK